MTEDFLIVGLGLIGGSYARGLRQAGCRVRALDPDGEAIAWALEHGVIDAGATDCSDWIGTAGAVVLGMYPTAMVDWVQAHREYFRPGQMVCDVAGVKGEFPARIQALLPPETHFIGCHPMAGREVSGVQNSDAAIFRDANFIITPTERNSAADIAFARQLAQTLGFRHIAELSPQAHDEMVGFVSQLTHAIAVSLMNCNGDPQLKEYTGDSFRDLTRIARINEVMWSELFLLNRETLTQEIDAFTGTLTHLRDALARGDRDELQRLFIQSTKRRQEFDRQ